LLGKECKRLCELTDSLDKSPLLKKENIARYNGTGDAAVEYGEICYEYYQIFESIND